nr:unnamed protein product [Callosobruchus chinensis]
MQTNTTSEKVTLA